MVERLLRKGKQALSLQPVQFDRGSSRLIWSIGLLNLLLIFLAPAFNSCGIGYWDNEYIGWIGVLLMLVGLTIRYLAAKTLGKFYTRTLQIFEGQQIVEQGLYRLIRHPGYLGTLIMDLGAGLAINNWAICLAILLTGFMPRLYRIYVEEEMLEGIFGEQYRDYSEKTWRLIPFIY